MHVSHTSYAVTIKAVHASSALRALVERTEPGPFRPRTIEMGTYHGIRH